MKVVIQRVKEASVSVDRKTVGNIGNGLLVLAGFEDPDTDEDLEWMARKISQLRIFNDEQQLMNLSVADVEGDILVVSQFTLHASTKKGNRPSYMKAAKPEIATALYERFLKKLETILGKPVSTGIFGAMMEVSLINDGPVTLIIDTKNKE